MRVLITDRTLFDHNRQPIRFGRMLLEALLDQSTLVVLSYDPEQTEIDLVLHGLDHTSLSVYAADDDLMDTENVSRARIQGRIDCLIDCDPALVTWAYAQGLNCLLALEPKFMDPRFRPDGGGVTAWTDMVAEMEAQTRMLAQKRERWEKSGFEGWE